MLTIGLIGGMSWHSSAEYYRLANELVNERLGGVHSAQCLLYSVDFAAIEDLQRQARWSDAGDILASAAKGLEAAGADLLLICANTMHKVIDQVSAAVSVPILHVADVVAEAVRAAGLETVGLLGTAYTMEQAFYRDRLASHGLTVLVPDGEAHGFAFGKGKSLYQQYQDRLKALNAADFGDLLLEVLSILKTQPDILAEYRDRFK